MKKFAITTFAVLYVALILSVSAERSSAWAVREAENLAHSSSSQHSHGLGKTEKSDTHLWQTKLIETEFVVELPREAASVPSQSERYILSLLLESHMASIGQSFSSRAPPPRA